jgi:hypothetical protein
MFVLAALDVPQPPSASDLFRLFLTPAEIRPAGDLTSLTTANQLRAIYSFSPVVADRWLDETLGYLQEARSYRDGWDGTNALAPSAEALKTTEYLTAFFADWPADKRPVLAIGFDGQPTFASKVGDFYLHLTVDGADKLSWYATAGAKEYSEEDIAFDGTALPSALAELAA